MAAQASSSAADVEWKPNASFLAACESLGLDEPAISDGEVKYDAETDTVYAPTREAVAEFRGQPKDDGAAGARLFFENLIDGGFGVKHLRNLRTDHGSVPRLELIEGH